MAKGVFVVARKMKSGVEEGDVKELIEEHQDELTIEELQVLVVK